MKISVPHMHLQFTFHIGNHTFFHSIQKRLIDDL